MTPRLPMRCVASRASRTIGALRGEHIALPTSWNNIAPKPSTAIGSAA